MTERKKTAAAPKTSRGPTKPPKQPQTAAGPYEIQARRIGRAGPKVDMGSTQEIENFWRKVIARRRWYDPDKETMIAFSLDVKLRMRAWHLVSIGTLKNAVWSPVEVFRPAILVGAASLVLAHNHPSGGLSPSSPDIQVTLRAAEAGALIDITFHDHIIIGARGHRSIRNYLDGSPKSPWPPEHRRQHQSHGKEVA